MMIRRPKGLGRGLDALLGDSGAAVVEAPPGAPQTLTLEQLRPGRYQPRTKMDPDSLSELADSIRAQGVIQPILVRPAGNDTYEDRKSTRLNSSHLVISYAVFCLKKKKN